MYYGCYYLLKEEKELIFKNSEGLFLRTTQNVNFQFVEQLKQNILHSSQVLKHLAAFFMPERRKSYEFKTQNPLAQNKIHKGGITNAGAKL